MKLKTLKEIYKENKYLDADDLREDLQQEAIKWIKEIKKFPLESLKNQSSLQQVVNDAIIYWIKYFFDITDDDFPTLD